MSVIRATCPRCLVSFVHTGHTMDQVRADAARSICQACQITMFLQELPPTTQIEKTALNWERVDGGLRGTEIERSERLLIAALGERGPW